jgi:hypothetical protein
MNRRYPAIAARAGHRCEYCQAPEAVFNFSFEVEHITPPGSGGTDDDENLALACRSCNAFKAQATDAVDPLTGIRVRLFHPRVDQWTDHFRPLPSGEVIAITEVGRATIAHLRLNSDRQVNARLSWAQISLYNLR